MAWRLQNRDLNRFALNQSVALTGLSGSNGKVRLVAGGFYEAISKIRPDAEGTDEVKWNFTKFLIGRDGQVVKRYEPTVLPADIKADLENYL